MFELRPELPELPFPMRDLQVDERGYPVPWFVAWIDGKPDFRVADAQKMRAAIKQRRCWLCGKSLREQLAFVIGPMCAINRISSEPPSHPSCAEFAVKACPFLTRPHMHRRENNLPEQRREAAGHGLDRNPGVSLIWYTTYYRVIRVSQTHYSQRGILLQVGDPSKVIAYAEGRAATVDEIRASVESGYPLLLEAAKMDGIEGVLHLEEQASIARQLLGLQ